MCSSATTMQPPPLALAAWGRRRRRTCRGGEKRCIDAEEKWWVDGGGVAGGACERRRMGRRRRGRRRGEGEETSHIVCVADSVSRGGRSLLRSVTERGARRAWVDDPSGAGTRVDQQRACGASGARGCGHCALPEVRRSRGELRVPRRGFTRSKGKVIEYSFQRILHFPNPIFT